MASQETRYPILVDTEALIPIVDSASFLATWLTPWVLVGGRRTVTRWVAVTVI